MQLQVLEEIISQLETNGIDYMLSGSMAMCIYTTPRFTRDFDIVVAINEDNVSRLTTFWEGRYYYSLSAIKNDIRQGRMFNVIHLETMHKIDFIVLNNTLFEQTKFARRQRKMYMNIELWVITPEDLILSKLCWIQSYESEIQKKDINNLLTIANLDRAYLLAWIDQLALNTYDINI